MVREIDGSRRTKSHLVLLAAAVTAASFAGSAQAQTFWDGSAGDNRWLNPDNWDSLGSPTLPAFGSGAVLNNGGTIEINEAGAQTGSFRIGLAKNTDINANNLGLGGTVNFGVDGTLTTGSDIPAIDIGVDALEPGGVAVWNHLGGTLTTGNLFRVAVAAGSTGTLNMSGGLIDVSTGDTVGLDFFLVGDRGNGTATMTGGEIRSRGLFAIALQPESTSSMTMSGNDTIIDARTDFVVGSNDDPTLVTGAKGTFTQNGGAVKVTGIYGLGWLKFAQGTTVQNGGSMRALQLLIGRDGTGTYTMNGASSTIDIDAHMVIATFAPGSPSTGTYTQTNGTLTTGGLLVSEQGNAVMNLSGGTVHVLGTPRNGANFPFAPGTDANRSFGNLIVGRDGGGPARTGDGTLNQTGGTMQVDTNVYLGDFDDSHGKYIISGGTLNVTGNFNVGGALASNSPLTPGGTAGQALGARGTLTVRGSAATINVGGHFRANPGDKTRVGAANVSELVFETDSTSGVSTINVAGVADLDGAIVDINLLGTSFVPVYDFSMNLLTASSFGATGTGATQNTGTGRAFTLAAADGTDWELRIIAGGNGEILQAVNRVVPGDTNADKAVNFDDLLTLSQNYNTATGATRATGDFNRDAAVNFDDLLTLAQNYGSSFSVLPAGVSSAFAADWALAQSLVPEPGSLSVLAGVAAVSLRRRRK